MAKENKVLTYSKKMITRKGRHSKKYSTRKGSNLYKKPYVGQGK